VIQSCANTVTRDPGLTHTNPVLYKTYIVYDNFTLCELFS